MSVQTVCPHCGSDQRGKQIAEEPLRGLFFGASADGEPVYYSRTLGVEIQGVYDGALFWQCPDCNRRWHRWPIGSDLYYRAQPYVTAAESSSLPRSLSSADGSSAPDEMRDQAAAPASGPAPLSAAAGPDVTPRNGDPS